MTIRPNLTGYRKKEEIFWKKVNNSFENVE